MLTLATGWLMDRYRQESLVKLLNAIEQRHLETVESMDQYLKEQGEENNALCEYLGLEEYHRIVTPVRDKYMMKRTKK